jgi:2-aminoethylphosphonate-pyruvate transaminase
MIGIILAAGSGRRLKINKPKGLLNIGEKALIEYSIKNLRRAGVDDIYVVTGFGADQYQGYFERCESIDDTKIKLIHNPEWRACGSGYSLQVCFRELAEKGIEDDLVILDSDILYNVDEFIDFINEENKDAILATNVPDGRHDACYIQTDLGDNLIKISKNLNELSVKDDDVTWEYIGITKVSNKSFKHAIEHYDNCIKRLSSIDFEYDYAWQELPDTFKIVKYRDYIWSESDDDEQLHYMITNTFPKITLH